METIPLGQKSSLKAGSLAVAYDFDALWNLRPDTFGVVKMFDKLVATPRWTQNYLRPYWYSGVAHPAAPLPAAFQPFLDWANTSDALRYGPIFNQVLVNWYESGLHYIGPHSDSERDIRPRSPIVSISLGQERLFRVREKGSKKIVLDHVMKGDTYLVMEGEMQQHFTHEVPKTTRAVVGRRINITLRCMD